MLCRRFRDQSMTDRDLFLVFDVLLLVIFLDPRAEIKRVQREDNHEGYHRKPELLIGAHKVSPFV